MSPFKSLVILSENKKIIEFFLTVITVKNLAVVFSEDCNIGLNQSTSSQRFKAMVGERHLMQGALRPILVFALLLLTGLPFTSSASAETVKVCCDPVDIDLFFTGDVDSGGLTPFHSTLRTEHEVSVTQSSGSETEIASWETNWQMAGTLEASTWSFKLPYVVESAAGVQISSNVEIQIGSETFVGSSQTMPYQQSGTIDIDVEVSAGELRNGDKIEVTYSVNTVLFESPVDDSAGITFIWGSDDYPGAVVARLPLLDIESVSASAGDGIAYFPIILRSGFAEDIWAHSTHQATLQSKELTETPLATKTNGGVEVTFPWNFPTDSDSGNYKFSLSITPQPGLTIRMNATHLLDITGGGGDEGVWYPENEPLRSGGSSLSVDIDVKQSGDELHRTTKIEFEGAMAIWLRWGLDNIGNDSLDSTSWWRGMSSQADTIPIDERHNRRVDESEVLALERHLTGSTSQLKDFLGNGLALEARGLLGAEPIDLGPTSVSIDLGSETGFGSGQMGLIIESMRFTEADEPMVLVRDFIRAQRDNYWTEISIDASLSTGLVGGISAVREQGADASHLRLGFTEILSVHIEGANAKSDFVIEFVPASNPIESPFVGSILTALTLLGGILLTRKISRGRKRTVLVLWNMLVVGLAGAGYILGLQMVFLLGAIAAIQIVVGVPIGALSPELSKPAPSSRISAALPSMRNDTIADCPMCGEENTVSTDERPTKIPCNGCGRTLRIEE